MDLSFIIVEYKDIETVRRAVRSIFSHIKQYEYEIIILCNSSYPKNIQRKIKDSLLSCSLIFQDNVGFSKAVNKGIKLSSGTFVVLLNPDAEFMDNSIEIAVAFMGNHKRAAIIGPKIIDNRTEIQDSCRKFMTPSVLLKRIFARVIKKSSGAVLEKRDYSSTAEVDWVSGACMLVRKSAIADVGPMDDRYFMYVEDMDWCRTFKKNGWQIWYLPRWSVEHNAGRGSSGRINLFNRLMWIHINSLLKYFVKWFNEK